MQSPYNSANKMFNAKLAIQFNNLGVCLVDKGNLRDALDLFKGASQLMTHIVSGESDGSASTMINMQATALRDSRVRQAHLIYQEFSDGDDSIDLSNLRDTTVSDMPSEDEKVASQSFVCRRAVSITDHVLPGVWTKSLALCCSVVLYNMGLVYHLAALESVLETTGQKAISLYEMAFTLLSEDNLELDSTFILQLMMYCLNNMASLNHDLTQWEMSTACMERLISLATLTQARGVSHSLHHECQSFILNAMVLKTPTRAPAA